MIEDRGAAGPYIEYDGLPVLHGSEVKLPLIHPYAPMEAGRYVTRRRTPDHPQEREELRPSADHAGSPRLPRTVHPAEGRRLPAARPGRRGLLRPCRVSTPSGVLGRGDALLRGTSSIPLAAFVRAVLAIELGDLTPAGRLVEEAEVRFGPVRPAEALDGEGQTEALSTAFGAA
ncbi:DUF6420 family protein [Streptomyces sp. NPDC004980]